MRPHPASPTPLLTSRSSVWLLAGLLLPLAACSRPGGGDAEAADDVEASERGGLREREAVRVVSAAVERREMRRVLETTSVVESETEIDVIPLLAGQVVELLVEENDPVSAGQILARLESDEQQLALRESEIALLEADQAVETAALAVEEAKSRIAAGERAFEQAERDYQRDVALRTGGDNKFGSVSERTVEASLLARDQAEQDLAQFRLALQRSEADLAAAKTAVTRARVARDRAALTLERMQIVAPIEGQIALRSCRVGDLVTTTEPAFRITDVRALRTVFFRPQRELSLFAVEQEGQSLELTATAEAVPGARFRGRIERVSPTIDAQSGSFRITASLEREALDGLESAPLSPGMLARIEIVTDRRPDALCVPKRAVRREGERAYVHAVDGDQVRRVWVVEGYTDDNFVEVAPDPVDALTDRDRVVVVGGRDLEEDALIEDTATDLPDAGGAAESDREQPATADGEQD